MGSVIPNPTLKFSCGWNAKKNDNNNENFLSRKCLPKRYNGNMVADEIIIFSILATLTWSTKFSGSKILKKNERIKG